jgi:hypothetical protein
MVYLDTSLTAATRPRHDEIGPSRSFRCEPAPMTIVSNRKSAAQRGEGLTPCGACPSASDPSARTSIPKLPSPASLDNETSTPLIAHRNVTSRTILVPPDESGFGFSQNTFFTMACDPMCVKRLPSIRAAVMDGDPKRLRLRLNRLNVVVVPGFLPAEKLRVPNALDYLCGILDGISDRIYEHQ